MPTAKASSGAMPAELSLGALIGLLWTLNLATLASLGNSDAAGNAIGESLCCDPDHRIMVVAHRSDGCRLRQRRCAESSEGPRRSSSFPPPVFAAMAAADLLARAYLSPFLWPLVIPAVVPPLVVIWCFLALRGRARMAGIVLGALPVVMVAVCLLIQPLSLMRRAVDDVENRAAAEYDTDLARVPAGAPMWEWTPFLDTRDDHQRAKVLDSIRGLEQRQVQAETMLDPRRLSGWVSRILRPRSDAGALRQGPQPASQAGSRRWR